jgi:hypothetical protein
VLVKEFTAKITIHYNVDLYTANILLNEMLHNLQQKLLSTTTLISTQLKFMEILLCYYCYITITLYTNTLGFHCERTSAISKNKQKLFLKHAHIYFLNINERCFLPFKWVWRSTHHIQPKVLAKCIYLFTHHQSKNHLIPSQAPCQLQCLHAYLHNY